MRVGARRKRPAGVEAHEKTNKSELCFCCLFANGIFNFDQFNLNAISNFEFRPSSKRNGFCRERERERVDFYILILFYIPSHSIQQIKIKSLFFSFAFHFFYRLKGLRSQHTNFYEGRRNCEFVA